MKYIIMAGGKYPKWGETPRQLLKLPSGETIIGRTIRILKEFGIKDISISTDNPAFEVCGVPLLKHNNDWVAGKHGYWTSAFYPTDEPACYIFGDVVYSENALRLIVTTKTDDIEFFASASPFDPRYIKDYCEPFCFKVGNQKKFRACIEICTKYHELGMFERSPIAWELWQVCNGGKLNHIARDFIEIHDYTCDVDSMSDIQKITQRVNL